jgi:hypothetical protein
VVSAWVQQRGRDMQRREDRLRRMVGVLRQCCDKEGVVGATAVVTRWHAQVVGARALGDVEEDIAVYKKARDNGEVELGVLKSRLKRQEREHQTELDTAQAKWLLMEAALQEAKIHGGEVLPKLAEESARNMQRVKEAEAGQQRLEAALRELYPMGEDPIGELRTQKQAADEAVTHAMQVEIELAAAKKGPEAAIQRMRERLAEADRERQVAVTRHADLLAAVRRSESGQVVVSLQEVPLSPQLVGR